MSRAGTTAVTRRTVVAELAAELIDANSAILAELGLDEDVLADPESTSKVFFSFWEHICRIVGQDTQVPDPARTFMGVTASQHAVLLFLKRAQPLLSHEA